MSGLLFVGDVSWDISFLTPKVPGPDEKVHVDGFVEGLGGVACNASVAAARAGAEVSFVGAVGTDILSKGVSGALAAEGVAALLGRRDGSICRVVTLIEPHGEKRLLLHPGVSLYPVVADLEVIDWERTEHVHTAVYGPAAFSLIDAAREHGATWSLDLEPSTFPEGITSLADALNGAAVLFVNDRAAESIGDNPVQTLLAMGAQSVIRSRGAEGAVWQDKQASFAVRAPIGLKVVDTTGAGDCLAGWYLAGMSRGLDPKESLTDAVRAASMSCGEIGAQAGYPRQREISRNRGMESI